MVESMRINGIGTVRKDEAMKVLTTEGRKAVKNEIITNEELGQIYKVEQAKKSVKNR